MEKFLAKVLTFLLRMSIIKLSNQYFVGGATWCKSTRSRRCNRFIWSQQRPSYKQTRDLRETGEMLTDKVLFM